VGSFALCEDANHLLVGFASGIALYDLRSHTHTPIVPVEADIASTRINDGRCDPQGRFVFGMFHPERGAQKRGSFYRVNHDLTVERLPLPKAAVANSICFSPDGGTLYFADSPARTIWSAPYAADGSIGGIREFVRMKEGDGFPDGSCIDAQGGLWNAQWQGSCVVRYDPTGRETDRIALPVSQPTCPAFGGAALGELFVTSARIGLKSDALAAQPQAGDLIRARTGCSGLAERRFRAGAT
jgi:L-arabinonolactonase